MTSRGSVHQAAAPATNAATIALPGGQPSGGATLHGAPTQWRGARPNGAALVKRHRAKEQPRAEPAGKAAAITHRRPPPLRQSSPAGAR